MKDYHSDEKYALAQQALGEAYRGTMVDWEVKGALKTGAVEVRVTVDVILSREEIEDALAELSE